ncbi:MAG: DUF1491 domain-containing protein [Hyphomicrobiales bacterium]|nr:MAG: DUF1491 domain-containing protein [Hyphomicrobiales bacterium]
MRVTSDLWVSAHVRRCFSAGAMALVARRGATEAGAIFLKINRLYGRFDLYGPAPQTDFDEDRPRDRLFERVLEECPESEIDERLTREARFDSDLWIVEIEDREGRAFLDGL